ncbi:MAG: chlorophyll a/b binding light-harvesting protein, partial [Cyanobacteria bacterium P01_H01_bin.26]
MDASIKKPGSHPWWAGNARFVDLSNTFIVAHVAQAAIIMAWVGVFTLFELSVYAPNQPMYEQGLILLPHLAAEGWGNLSDGSIVDTYPMFAIGVIHLVAAGVLAFGAYFHRNSLPRSLDMAQGNASKFDFAWNNPKQLGFILGHHLVILGLGALLLVIKALYFGGLYDTSTETVRLVTDPTLDPATLWDYRTRLFQIDSLEDLVGGHIYVAVLLIVGGAWHILTPPFKWVQDLFVFSADGILSYSLFGIAIASFAASYYCAFDTLSYPTEFYGPTLELKSAFPPSYFDPNQTVVAGYASRTWLANTQFYLAFFFLQGGLWHFQRAMGFDISSVVTNWQEGLAEFSDSPELAYQTPVHNEPQPRLDVQYGMPQAALPSLLRQEQPFGDYLYRQAQGIGQPDLTTINGMTNTLYQTEFHTKSMTFYQSSAQEETPTAERNGDSLFGNLYGQA